MPDLRTGLPAPARGDEVSLHAGLRAPPWRIEKNFAIPTRPAGPTGLPAQTRIDRSPPHARVRRTNGPSLDRAPNGLEHPEIRPDRTPLPDITVPSRTTDHHRRPPATRRPPLSPQQDQFTLRCALNCPRSGLTGGTAHRCDAYAAEIARRTRADGDCLSPSDRCFQRLASIFREWG